MSALHKCRALLRKRDMLCLGKALVYKIRVPIDLQVRHVPVK